MPLHIGDTNAGTVECVDINRVATDVYRVTVRELIGGAETWAGGKFQARETMRRLARRIAPRGAEVHTAVRSEFTAGSCWHVTFVVSWSTK